MMTLFLTFLIAFGISYLGSIPPGSMNLTVFNYSLQQQYKKANHFILSAALVEILYIAIALFLQSFLRQNEQIATYFKWIASAVLSILAIGYFIKIKPAQKLKQEKDSKKEGWIKGALISLGNPMALIFWLATASYLRLNGIIPLDSFISKILFIVGAFLGTAILLYTVVILTKRFKLKEIPHKPLNLIMGLTFLILSVYVFFK